jgi:toxin HigB-1
MDLEYADERLRSLANDLTATGGFDGAVVKAFRKRIQFIRAAPDERTFYSMKSLHYEKLQGDREGQHSMRLNDQWRLILRFAVNDQGKRVVILSITDYH